MKTHLFRPNDILTMCGIEIKSFSTTDPFLVDCQRCFGRYAQNVDWYWFMSGISTPGGARWLHVDIPFPGLFYSNLRSNDG